jgi:hypothetical protein
VRRYSTVAILLVESLFKGFTSAVTQMVIWEWDSAGLKEQASGLS